MVSQLPHGAEGAAAVTVIYTCASAACSSLVIWLTWAHNERLSYIALVSCFALLSTVASFIQQIHDISDYRNVMFAQYDRKIADPNSADNDVANGSIGMDLVLYYIQWYCYNVESMLVMFWGFELAQSLYGLTEKPATRAMLRKVNSGGKVVAVILPLSVVLGLRAPAIQSDIEKFQALAFVPLGISLACGSLLMIAILFRYIQSRRKLVSFNPHNGFSTGSENSSSGNSSSGILPHRDTRRSRRRPKGMYDRWLMMRFTIGFVLLTIFQVTAVLFQRYSKQRTDEDLQSTGPDLSASRARQTLFLFLPGNTPGIAIFLVFGTTAAFRQHMRAAFSWASALPTARQRRQQQHHGGGAPNHGSRHHDHPLMSNPAAGGVGGGGGGAPGVVRSYSFRRLSSSSDDGMPRRGYSVTVSAGQTRPKSMTITTTRPRSRSQQQRLTSKFSPLRAQSGDDDDDGRVVVFGSARRETGVHEGFSLGVFEEKSGRGEVDDESRLSRAGSAGTGGDGDGYGGGEDVEKNGLTPAYHQPRPPSPVYSLYSSGTWLDDGQSTD
ncbi:hypothetical protein GGR56DRAFT_514296 [Xylariaceae sp. FL0804]|nr:hypothetical protein GGR56DRAFT_514296 [Xylariaceae sp. FL0804]